MERQANTEYILSLSYGKDSLACLESIKQLGYPLDRIVHAEVWATDDIPADLPPMVEFKKHADEIIKDKYGYDVEHISATKKKGGKNTYEKQFYQFVLEGQNKDKNYGFPYTLGAWCNSRLKVGVWQSIARKSDLRKTVLSSVCLENETERGEERCLRLPSSQISLVQFNSENSTSRQSEKFKGFSTNPVAQGAKKNIVQYLGIAADEPERIKRHTVSGKVLPLVDIGWDEAYCRQWCEENDLLSPIYTTAARGGCWFCHNQGVDQLRQLRRDYPDLWQLLLKWDKDRPVSFHADGHTVHDFDKRFFAEDLNLVPKDRKFRWKNLDVAFAEYLDDVLGGD